MAVIDDVACDTSDDDGGSPHFKRRDEDLSCLSTGVAHNLVFESESSWRSFWAENNTCGGDTAHPAVDFDTSLLVGVMLDGNCAYSGCTDTIPMIHGLLVRGCTLQIGITSPSPADLGSCRQCVQPRDFVSVQRRLVSGVEEVVFEHRR